MTKTFEALTPKQKEARKVMGGDATHILGVGGSRSGKTFLFVRAIVIRAVRFEESYHLIGRLHGNALRASVWLDTFPSVMRMCFPGVRTRTYRQDGFEEFVDTGSRLWFGGLDDKDRTEKILGNEYATIFPNECSQIPYSSILLLRTRLAQNIPGCTLRAFYDLNPPATSHWSHLEFFQGKNPLAPREDLAEPEDFAHFFINPEDNRANLDPKYIRSLRNLPKQYRLRFYEGKYVQDIEGALWTVNGLEATREMEVTPDAHGGNSLAMFQRIVIGVDPSGALTKDDIKSDEIGIVVVGRTHEGRALVLEDATVRGSPAEWGRAVAGAYKKWRADRIVAEANYGGAMVMSTIRASDKTIPVELVHASRGKHIRAEPISVLYEEGLMGHAGYFPELEEQLCQFSKFGYQGGRSPDRADALIWAATDLMVDQLSTYTLANIS